ncbi:hypothetical protein KR032_009146 [Drosophila birchii]|nr:hypothetical protein KR032_009146 [Drosophila birchii]
MQDSALDLYQYEDNLLPSCWRVGACHSRAAVLSSLNRTEISAVDVVACCKQITSLAEKKVSELQRSRSLAPSRQVSYHFKDFAQLTSGVTNIYCRQVNVLLEDTKHLLDQMKGSTFDLVLTTKKSVTRNNRKRKSVITKESKMTVAKRLKLDESDLFHESVQQHYSEMLSECQVWQSECTQRVKLQESIELPRSYNPSSSYHALTITEEFEIHEDPSDIYPSQGFGDCDQPDLTFFQALYPRRSVKRRLTIRASTDILPAKMPRFDDDIVELNTFQTDSASPVADSIAIDTESITYIVCEPDLFDPPSRRMSSATQAFETMDNVEIAQLSRVKNTAQSSRRKKLIIDKCIEYSREMLIKEQCRYRDNLEKSVVRIPLPGERRKPPEDLLFKLNKQISTFPKSIRNYSVTLTKEEMEMLSEVTLRSIFGVEFTEEMVKEIFLPIKSRKIKQKNIAYQAIGLTPPPVVESPNNNILIHTKSYEDNHFDAYAVMTDLLVIWRNNPEIQGIDANNFIKMFPDRIRAALAFNFLLCKSKVHKIYIYTRTDSISDLARDRFIKISKKPNSLEMDKIELGSGSNKLIESLAQDIF